MILGSPVSDYFDLRAALYRRAFGEAAAYPDYFATGDARERRAWERADAAVPALPEDAATRLDGAGRSGALSQRGLVRGLFAVGAGARAAGAEEQGEWRTLL